MRLRMMATLAPVGQGASHPFDAAASLGRYTPAVVDARAAQIVTTTLPRACPVSR